MNAIPKYLYHGTSAKQLSSIRKHGLQPSKHTSNNNWENCPANPNAVYLTNSYAHYYASCAVKGNGDLAIVRIDTEKLDLALFCADEDPIAQVWVNKPDKNPKGLDLIKLTEEVRAEIEFFEAEVSMGLLGTCAYLGAIPPEAIDSVVTMTMKANSELVWAGYDPTISIMNYRIIGHKYRNLMEVIFSAPDQQQEFSSRDHERLFKKVGIV